MLHQDRRRAESFGEDAEQYDRARPSYPAALVDDLIAASPTEAAAGRTGASPQAGRTDGPPSVLDVGAGTGIAARLFVERGCPVLCLELDPRMARVARTHGLPVEEGRFEDWEPGGRRFDLVIAAQAWHWVEPSRGTPRAADVLVPGGRIGLFWNQGTYDPDLRQAFREVYRARAPQLERSIILSDQGGGRAEAAARELASEDRFGDPGIDTYPGERSYPGDRWLDQLATHSDHRTLPDPDRRALLDDIRTVVEDHGGRVVVAYRTWLVSANRR